ncbi:PspC domain-containing protein [Anaeromyxobacter sp. Fw109-5]|uniref:PspC domain-containing protein n=1 Tax=Anaeromyxobacter sp. (strain Fw109-5) TaxID=404589 RepID=UPI0000ED6D04|nr:PspC domain-containing protein [Anaeromyxobacter sp. Fw109-5]ABS27969.1 phage shock protein C, PspC [Anaeromyxobacter sp. Fw109-5]
MICPYCRTENLPGATRCAACTSWMVERPPTRDWMRAREGRIIAGVSRGLANRFGVPCAAVRLVFLLSILFGGWGILAYVALWIAMPLEPLALPPATIERREPEAVQRG